MMESRLWKLDKIFSSSNFKQNLIWRECSMGALGRLITKP
ncbi:hypothetical protein CFP56_036284 [Quercus suber]|uniref:Uncharacterized protein n=1 Tax=Quercus suber TaxID=58331 RepID=A0AAW0J7Q9_QUESU